MKRFLSNNLNLIRFKTFRLFFNFKVYLCQKKQTVYEIVGKSKILRHFGIIDSGYEYL